MANLIITIISIALVAVAALMGAYYGGTAFLQGQAKAYANAAISQGEQLVAAWSIYAADRGGSWTLTALADMSSTSPAYLASLPRSPASVTSSSGISAWAPVNLSAAPGAAANFNAVYFQLTDDSSGVNVCNLVAQAFGGSTAVPTSISASTNMIPAATGRKFDCVYIGTASISAPTTASAVAKYVYYRAY